MQKAKSYISFFLLLSVGFKLLIGSILCVDYQLRKDFITKTYCINKNKPALNCNGQCYLAKKLKLSQEKEEKEATAIFINTFLGMEITDNLGLVNLAFQKLTVEILTQNNFHYFSPKLDKGPLGIFHPPQV